MCRTERKTGKETEEQRATVIQSVIVRREGVHHFLFEGLLRVLVLLYGGSRYREPVPALPVTFSWRLC